MAHLVEQLAHVLGTGARRRLIGHGGHPLDHIGLEQAAKAHQHQADGAVATHEGFGTFRQLRIDDLAVHRVEDDGGFVFHPQGAGGIDPVALPTAAAQVAVDLLGVVTALTGDDHVQRFQVIQCKRIFQRRHVHADVGAGLANLRSGEKDRLNAVKITIFLHALHQHRANHATPSHETDFQHVKSSN